MNVEDLRIGTKVRHPAYGGGVVVALTEHTADVRFEDGGKRSVSPRDSGLQPAEEQVDISGMSMPLRTFIAQVVDKMIDKIGIDDPKEVVHELGARWDGGMLVMKPRDTGLQTKEVPIETFFHKIVMMRNQLRVLEQKINSHSGLSDGDKVELQQYITRCYGSMTTFNLLFRNKEDQFGGG